MPAPHPSRRLPSYPIDVPLKSWIGRVTHGISPTAVAAAMEDWLAHLAFSPGKQVELLESAIEKALKWGLYVQQSLLAPDADGIKPLHEDKRFEPRQWEQPPFAWQAQAFLLMQQWWHEASTGVRGVSAHHEHVTEFVIRQWLDVWSPSNFPWSNPQVLEEIARTGGQNLTQGAANWWRDAMAVATNGAPAGVENFRPGERVALTPGKVVFRNRLIELIEYAPTTPQVHPEPLLIVPSWIMKYYILDLLPENSMVKYLVEHGHTVYMISWKNPDASDGDLGLEDYLDLGVLAALRAVTAARHGAAVHGMGYCLGGTLLAIAAAALTREAKSPLKTLSLLAAQIDFEEPGELALFIDESQVAFLEDVMSARGYLDGRQMSGAFALINSKDLVWSKLVHEYLMGGHTPLNALRAWNADATRMPLRMHSEYLRRLYLNNDLAEGRYEVHGRPVALKDLRMPLFVVATERDHVSPWRSVYKINLLTHTDVDFVLSSGGHNVGIIAPPQGPAASPQASYRVERHVKGSAHVDADTWHASTELQSGSWWPVWQRWLAERSGPPMKPLPIGGEGPGQLRMLGDAPGSYIHGV